jgi:flagellar hook-associated protein 3 FlgL
MLTQMRLSRRQTDLKAQLDRTRAELTTGKAVSRYEATGGDPIRLMALDNAIRAADARTPLIGLAGSRAAATQTALETVQQAAPKDFATRFLGFVELNDGASAQRFAKDARAALEQVIAALNTSVAGRAVFGGDEGGGPPMDDVDTLLADVASALEGTLLAGVPDPLVDPAPSPEAQLAHYFGTAPIAGQPATATFDARMYKGGAGEAPPVELAEGDMLSYGVKANDPALKAMMRDLAVTALVGETTDPAGLGLAPTATADEVQAKRMALWKDAATGMLAADDAITDLRADLGLAETRIEDAQTWTRAQRDSLDLARAGIEEVDAYEAATRLSQLETQLQALYEVTARTAQLSILSFLR